MRLAPVTDADAHAMIQEVKGLAVIRGYRGLPMGDCNALARTVSAFSQLTTFVGILQKPKSIRCSSRAKARAWSPWTDSSSEKFVRRKRNREKGRSTDRSAPDFQIAGET